MRKLKSMGFSDKRLAWLALSSANLREGAAQMARSSGLIGEVVKMMTGGVTEADVRALRRSGLTLEHAGTIAPPDAERIAALYHQLYVGRYSAINPLFTPDYIAFSAASGLLTYCTLRDGAGQIMAFAALASAGGVGTVPLMGYDTSRPQEEALYRIASYCAADLAQARGLRFHGSAGAGQFKRNRGARGVIEYMAVDARHLSRTRRAGLAALAAGLGRFMVPMLERNGW
jgi:hypothetical protein